MASVNDCIDKAKSERLIPPTNADANDPVNNSFMPLTPFFSVNAPIRTSTVSRLSVPRKSIAPSKMSDQVRFSKKPRIVSFIPFAHPFIASANFLNSKFSKN